MCRQVELSLSCPLTLLWLKSQAKERGATAAFWAELQVTVARTLRRAIRRRGARLTPADIDDLEQELLMDVWQIDLARFDVTRGSLGAFIQRRVQWKLVDHLRALGRRRTESLEARLESGQLDPVSDGAEPDVMHEAGVRELTLRCLPAAVKGALDGLDDAAAAAAVTRHDLEGVPLCEVARELGLHPSSATRARQRGLKRLAGDLSPAFALAA